MPLINENYQNISDYTDALICKNCDFVFSSKRMTVEEEHRLYSNYRSPEYYKIRKEFDESYDPTEFADSNSNQYYVDVRKQSINLLLTKNIDLNSINRVLDWGGDNGIYISEFSSVTEKFVYELSDVSLLPSIKKYKLSDQMLFDLILCCHVLEHVSSPDKIILEIKKHINKNGWLYIEVPNFDIPSVPKTAFGEHVNRWGLKSMKAFLIRNGFDIRDIMVYNECLCVVAKINEEMYD